MIVTCPTEGCGNHDVRVDAGDSGWLVCGLCTATMVEAKPQRRRRSKARDGG